jgi:hypothetical protein
MKVVGDIKHFAVEEPQEIRGIYVQQEDFFYVLYSTLFHLPTLTLHCVGGCWDRTVDNCDFGNGSQTL